MSHLREVLFSRSFFPLWAGQIISEFGDRLNQMALISLVYHMQPGSVMALANILLFTIVPVFVIGPVAGVYVDRWDRRTVMIVSDIARGILVLFIPVVIWLKMMPLVYVLVFLIFSATRFFLPSKMAFIPDIVSQEKLLAANSLSNTTRMIATVMGFALAGFIIKWVGYMAGFYLDSLSFFISGALIASIAPIKKLKNVKEDIEITKDLIERSIRRNVWQEIVEGFGYMVSKSKMRIVTSTLFLVMAGAGSVFCVIIVFVQQSFGSVTEDVGVLGVFLGVGLFLGTLLYGKFGQALSKVRTIFASITACGIAIGLFALLVRGVPSLALAGVVSLVIGASAGPVFVCTNTLIHALVPDEARGRIFSSMEMVMHLAFIVMMFATAQISKITSNFSILLASAAAFAVLGMAGQVFARKDDLSC